MKKLTVFILIYFISLAIHSQENYTLIEENRTWNVISVGLVGPNMWDTTYSTITYEFFGDTIIDAKTYLKLYHSNEENPINWNLWCFMREDGKKVWCRHKTDDHEVLMYDFNLNVGDSISDMTGFSTMIVDSIGYETINQEERKKYWLSSIEMPDYYTETWIDGIGSNKGICWGGSVLIVGGWYRYLCMSEYGELIYRNPNYESCYLITDVELNEFKPLNIYPNPASNYINLSSPFTSLKLYTLSGQLILTTNVGDKQVSIESITPGVYIATIINGGKEIGREKLIVR